MGQHQVKTKSFGWVLQMPGRYASLPRAGRDLNQNHRQPRHQLRYLPACSCVTELRRYSTIFPRHHLKEAQEKSLGSIISCDLDKGSVKYHPRLPFSKPAIPSLIPLLTPAL